MTNETAFVSELEEMNNSVVVASRSSAIGAIVNDNGLLLFSGTDPWSEGVVRGD
jgi:gamma-glutamyltranspeptidase